MKVFPPAPGTAAGAAPTADRLEHAARAADIADRMRACLDELDRLGLWKAGAYLDQALHELERKGHRGG